MATTVSSDLIIPEVWADTVGPLILGKSVMVPLSTTDDTLVGQPGEKIVFPKFNYIGDAVDLAETESIVPEKLTMTDSEATIKEAGKGVEITDKAVLTSVGQPMSETQRQLATSIARKLDKDIRQAAEEVITSVEAGVDHRGNARPGSSPLIVDATNEPFSWGLFTAAAALFGDEYDPSEIAAVVLHSAQHIALMNDPKFQSVDTFGPGAVIMRGQVGRIGSVPIVVSDQATATQSADATPVDRVRALIVKRGSLAINYKRRPIVETDRDILARSTVVTTNVHYGTKRVNDRGVVLLDTGK